MLGQPATKEFEIWPPHITIVPWFPCSDAERLDRTLQQIAAKYRPFLVRAGQIERWGSEEKFEVQLVEDEGQLYRLHWDTFHALEKNGFPIHQKDYLGDKYRPHITLRNRLSQQSRQQGEAINIKSFTLVKQSRLKKTGSMIKEVIRDYGLNG